MFKCELLIGGNRYDATNDLKNWDDFDLAHKRSSYDGVARTFSSQFEFVKKAYNLLKSEFYSKYLSATATVIFSLRNNSWEYDEVFRCALDFSTYSEDGYVVSINAIDNTLAAIIKAKKSIQYEYPVADLETSNLKYDGLKFQYEGKYTLGGQSYESDGVAYINIQKVLASTSNPYHYSIPLYKLENSELPKLDSPLRFDDVSFTELSNLNECSPFIEALSDIYVDINFRTDYYVTTYAGGIEKIFLLIFKKDSAGGVTEIKSYESDGFYKYINDVISNVYLAKGESLIFAIRIYFSRDVGNNIDIAFPNFSFSINFKSRINSIDVNVISPNTILSKLLDSMTENTIEHQGAIDYALPSVTNLPRLNLLLERTYIMAAESARGLPKAKVYTSYKKFCEWMEAEFGYVPVINENTVTFMHRDKLFTSTVVKNLETEINDYEFSVNDSLIYSSVKVGYDKQDYDSINGRDEFRFTNEFSTGLKLTDNTLYLISPYRADAYGIEFLVQKRGEDTTDNDSDNDVFFVECINNPSTGILNLNRPYSEGQLSGLLSPNTMFNLNYSPRFMLEANKKYIGACTNLLKFASSDGNSDVSIDGVKEMDDFSIPERLFTVSEVEVETSDINSPDNLLGLVSFNNKGEIVTGYIKQLKLNIAKEKAATYTLIVKDINISGAQEDKSITVIPKKLAFEEYESKKANVITDPHEISWATTIKDN